MSTTTTLDEVASVLAKVLGIDDVSRLANESTQLLGSLPEFDSMAVVEVVAALEERFGITIHDDEVTGEIFETVGSLVAFINAKRS